MPRAPSSGREAGGRVRVVEAVHRSTVPGVSAGKRRLWHLPERGGWCRREAGHDGVMTGFKGWPESALDFYEGLEADNSRAYWNDHKDVYERDVKAPMEALLAELASEFGEARLFRPIRDTRFSRDKSPYKTAIAARIGEGYVQFSGNGLMAGVGTYHMAPDQLVRYRKAAAADGTGRQLGAVVDALRAAHRGHRDGDAQDRATGIPEGPSPDRAAAPQGSALP